MSGEFDEPPNLSRNLFYQQVNANMHLLPVGHAGSEKHEPGKSNRSQLVGPDGRIAKNVAHCHPISDTQNDYDQGNTAQNAIQVSKKSADIVLH